MKEETHKQTQTVRILVPSTCPAKNISSEQREEGRVVFHHVQGEHHQTYLLHYYQNVNIQNTQIQ